MSRTPPLCPDCGVEIFRIQIIDQNGQEGAALGLTYLVKGASKAKWAFESEGLKNKGGTVNGYLCDQCNRVLLYATPELEEGADRESPTTGGLSLSEQDSHGALSFSVAAIVRDKDEE